MYDSAISLSLSLSSLSAASSLKRYEHCLLLPAHLKSPGVLTGGASDKSLAGQNPWHNLPH